VGFQNSAALGEVPPLSRSAGYLSGSILQRKVLTPNDLTDPDALTARVLAFQDRYNATATPFDWKFTRTDLDQLLERIAAHESAPAPATTMAA
jgi:hypothetical protein